VIHVQSPSYHLLNCSWGFLLLETNTNIQCLYSKFRWLECTPIFLSFDLRWSFERFEKYKFLDEWVIFGSVLRAHVGRALIVFNMSMKIMKVLLDTLHYAVVVQAWIYFCFTLWKFLAWDLWFFLFIDELRTKR
jgi:hypothetical protein